RGGRVAAADPAHRTPRRAVRGTRNGGAMRSRNTRCALPLLSALLLSSCAGQSQAPAVDAATMTAALDSLNKAFSAAVAARDTDAVAAFYSPDAHVLAAGMPRADGHDAI